MNLRDLRLRARALFRAGRVERELDEELRFHVERQTAKHVAEGLSPEDARAQALARFGPLSLAADQCRDARGTALVDDTWRDIRYAFRTLARAPLASLTVVATVALGLGLVAVVFAFFNIFVFRVDQVRDVGELYAVERSRTADGDRVPFTLADYDAIRRDTRVFSDVFAMLPDISSRIDGRIMEGVLVTGNFFQGLGVRPALGRQLTPDDDERFAGRPVMVLSHKGWVRLFSSDPSIVGRSVIVGGSPIEIVGVMPDGFRGLSVGSPDYWAPLALLGQFRPIHAGREPLVGIDVIGRLKPGLSPKAALAGLTLWMSEGTDSHARGPVVTLQPKDGTIPNVGEGLLLFTPIFFVFGLILLIGCANVANLLLARAMARQHEIGIRLSLGASRRRIVRQLLTESLMLAVVAAALGYVVSRLILGAALYAFASTIPAEISENIRLSSPEADWRMAVFLVAGALASTVLFGLAPALHGTRLDLVRTMRGEVTRDARPSRARNALVALQVTASALFLIASAIFLRSALASATVDPGFRTSDTVVVEVVNEPTRVAMLQAVRSEPYVAAVAAAWPHTLDRPRVAFAEPAGEAGAVRSTVAYRFVSPEYFDVIGIPILRGRPFTQTERNSAVVILSESTARQLWPTGDAVGQVMHLDPDPRPETRRSDEPPLPGRTFVVVGIIRDLPGFRLAEFDEAGVFVPTAPETAEMALTLRVHGDPDVARGKLLQRLTAVDPNMGQVATLRALARMEGYVLKAVFWVTLVLGALALVLTVSGLFSVLSYLVEQRRKEIGVRMALGATARNVARLVVAQCALPVALGLAVGGGLAAAVAIALLATPAAAKVVDVVHVDDPVAYVASLAVIVTACAFAAAIPALRAARIDPMQMLRQD